MTIDTFIAKCLANPTVKGSFWLANTQEYDAHTWRAVESPCQEFKGLLPANLLKVKIEAN